MAFLKQVFHFCKNFVQPSETDHPKRLQNPVFGRDRRGKSSFFGFLRVNLCFFAYEYTKTVKLPFPVTRFFCIKTLTMVGRTKKQGLSKRTTPVKVYHYILLWYIRLCLILYQLCGRTQTPLVIKSHLGGLRFGVLENVADTELIRIGHKGVGGTLPLGTAGTTDAV